MKKADIDPARSAQMALVRSKDTSPELRVRRYLHQRGLRYVLYSRHVPGSPDITFPSRRIALFVHGCFWHRHPNCAATRTPKTRIEFWTDKFHQNVDRDERTRQRVMQMGWTPLVIWECETNRPKILEELFVSISSIPSSPKKGISLRTGD